MIAPFAISGVSSLAKSAVDAWNRLTEPKQAAQTPAVGFQELLNKAAAGSQDISSIQRQLAALPEVKAALARSGTANGMQFVISPNGTLSQLLPGGGSQNIPLSEESRALCQSWTAANPAAAIQVSL